MKRTVAFLFAAFVIITMMNADFLRAQLTEPPDSAALIAELQQSLPAAPALPARTKDADLIEQELSAQSAFDEKREEARAACTDNLRRANRDNRTETLLQCYRSDLQLELGWLRQMKPRILKLIASDGRTALEKSTHELLEALVTIIDGIDTGVFTEEADILESKDRLLEKYRIPFWAARVSVLRERLLWQTRGLVDEIATLEEAKRSSMGTSLVCLRDATKPLWEPETDLANGREALRNAQATMLDCLSFIDSALLNTGTGATVTP